MTDEPAQYGLLISFPDESAAFTSGFEAGIIHERMQNGAQSEFEMTTHTENREVIARMAVAHGWSVEVEGSVVVGWDHTILRKSQPAPARSNPHGLRLVKS